MECLPEDLVREILTYLDVNGYRERFVRIQHIKQNILLWKPEYLSIIDNYSPFYHSFQWIDLKHNHYEQQLAVRLIHETKLKSCLHLLQRLNELYSRKYYKQETFTNLYDITFTKEQFDRRYQKLLTDGCVNWKGEDPLSWLNY